MLERAQHPCGIFDRMMCQRKGERMLRLNHLLAAALFAGTAIAQAQSSDPLFTASKEQLEVVKVVLAQQEEWNAGELDRYLSHFKEAPDTSIMLAGPVRGFVNIRNAFRGMYPNRDTMGELDNSEVEVRELGENFALATGRYHLVRSKKGGGEIRGTFSEIFEKTPSGWKVIFSESI
jgi:ketosteroid isomerase-like protein